MNHKDYKKGLDNLYQAYAQQYYAMHRARYDNRITSIMDTTTHEVWGKSLDRADAAMVRQYKRDCKAFAKANPEGRKDFKRVCMESERDYKRRCRVGLS